MSLFRRKSIDKIVAAANKEHNTNDPSRLLRVLNTKDLTLMGVAAIVGAGIFSTIGMAAHHGGVGVIFLFILTAITCGFSALCYAEFAGRVPISGSAYTYAYVSFGEIVAWVIGWALILEYAIGNIVVAISWSGYFNNLLQGLNIHLPNYLLTDVFTAKNNFAEATAAIIKHQPLTEVMQHALDTWHKAPIIAGCHCIINVPAFLIIAIITWCAYVGIHESKRVTNFMVLFKIFILLLVIVLGFFYVNTENWKPILPNGFKGVLASVSAVFFAYIGFDAISTTAEECKNPQRDLPRAMMYTLIICTVLYVLVVLILTGMLRYTSLNVSDPLSYVFERLHLKWVAYAVSISAVVATTSVILVFQLGQPRIWMSMSRDGLLPKKFASVHPKFRTPAFATIITGVLVGVPSLFVPDSLMTDLTSIGTLFAFVIVCAGVLTLPKLQPIASKKTFSIPYINSKWILPLFIAIFIFFFQQRIHNALQHWDKDSYQEILFLLFCLISIAVALVAFFKKYSLIPLLGALSCLYLMIEIPAVSWLWFFIWMLAGLVIYWLYGRKYSILKEQKTTK